MNTISLDILLGAFLPVVLEFIFRYIGDKAKLKFAVSLVLPLLLGVGLNYNSLDLSNVDAVLGSGALIFTAAQGVYRLYFKDSGLQKRVNK